MEIDKILKFNPKAHILIIVLLGLVFYVPFIGNVHLFDWDEINFAECSREMLLTGNFRQVQINFEPFWEKPPLFFWLQTLSMQIFGVNELAARLPNAITGIFTLLAVYIIGKKEKNAAFGFIWAIVFFGALLPFLYFKSGIIDPVFNLFIFLSVYFTYKNFSTSKIQFAVFAGFFNGLALLTKGPVGLLLLLLTAGIYVLINKFKVVPKFKSIVLFVVTFILTTLLWYGIELFENGFWFLEEFVRYQVDLFKNPVAGHEQPFYYHFVVVLFGCFPLSIFALPHLFSSSSFSEYKKWNYALFWVVMLLFSIVTTKIVHYSSMAYLPLSFLAALTIYNNSMKRYVATIFLVIGLVFSILITVLLFVPLYLEEIIPYIDNEFTKANLTMPVYWSGLEFLIGIVLLAGVISAYLKLKSNKIQEALLHSSASVVVFLLLMQAIIAPKIEQYSQGGAIQMYQELKGKEVFVTPSNFKSYAHFFYFQSTETIPWEHHLLTRNYNKPIYFVCRIDNDNLKNNSKVTYVKTIGGYVLYQKLPISK